MNLVNEAEVKKRVMRAYDNMRTRARPKKWKSGKRRGTVRKDGLDQLPFTRQEFWSYAYRQVGWGVILCPYCKAIGRNAAPISLMNCTWDHKVPLAHGPEAWLLSNLFAVCEDCNRLKGHLTYPFFVAIMAAIERWEDPRDRTAMYACMRTHGVTMRLKFQPKDKVTANPELANKAEEYYPLLPLKKPVDLDW